MQDSMLMLNYCSNVAFSALTLSIGRQEGHLAFKNTELWGTGVVICLKQLELVKGKHCADSSVQVAILDLQRFN